MLVMCLYPSTAACLMAGMTPVRNIVVLTGAGVSAESGLATFRGPDGLWDGHRVQDVCTPEALAVDPALVHGFYDARRAALANVAPNPAHVALARLDAAWSGELLSGWCRACDGRNPWTGSMGVAAECPQCGARAVRPDIVFFGEMPYRMEAIEAAISRADIFVSIGTSGAVYPAAGFVRSARWHGAQTLELNLDPSEGSHYFDESRMGPAGQLVPAWVDEMLAMVGQAQS